MLRGRMALLAAAMLVCGDAPKGGKLSTDVMSIPKKKSQKKRRKQARR